MGDVTPVTRHCRSPNVLSLGDRVMCRLPWGSEPFPVRIRAITRSGPEVVADPPSDDPFVDNDFGVAWSWLSRIEEPDAS